MRELLQDTAERAILYLEGLNARNVQPTPEAVAKLKQLDTPLPDDSTEPEAVIQLLDEICSPATTAMAGPRYFGFVTGGSLPVTVAANWLAGAWDQNNALYTMAPAMASLEQVALRWLIDVLGLPSECGGAFVTGATMANLSALAAARHAVLQQAGWNVEADGLFGAPPIMVVVGAEAHPSLFKALGLLGLGRNRVVKVPADSQGRLRPEAIPAVSGPTIICAQAGNVNTGAFDPFTEICARAHESGAWVHVDGAFGLWATAAPARAHLTAGVAGADSWATDAHKWLNVPYDSGIVLVRDPAHLQAAMAVNAPYLVVGEAREPEHFVPDFSRRARGVEVWAALRSLGRQGLADLVARTCRHATRFAAGLREAGYQILNDVVINQVLVSFGDADTTRRVVQAIQADGTCWAGTTVWQGHTAMRISVSSWATRNDDVEQSLATMIRIAGAER